MSVHCRNCEHLRESVNGPYTSTIIGTHYVWWFVCIEGHGQDKLVEQMPGAPEPDPPDMFGDGCKHYIKLV